LDLEEAGEEEAVGDGVKVFVAAEELEDLGRVGLRKPVFAPIAEELLLIGEGSLVFRRDALIAVRL